MWKYAFSTLIGITAIICAGLWYVEILIPQRLFDSAIENTSKYSSICENVAILADRPAKPPLENESKRGLACRRIDLNAAEIEICHKSFIAPKTMTDVIPLKQNQIKIRARSVKYDFDANYIIDIGTGKIADSHRDVSVTSSSSYIFFGYVRQMGSPERYAISIRVLDSHTGKNLLEKEIFSKHCCIENLTISYDRRRSKLLFAWNDWSHNDDKNLFLGVLDEKQLLNGNVSFLVKQIVLKDKWDKRNPYFLIDNEKIYLVYATGDHWGWLSYSGRPSVGLYAINDKGEPTQYYIIASKKAVGKVLKIQNDYLYYELLDVGHSRVVETRKIHLNDMFKILMN